MHRTTSTYFATPRVAVDAATLRENYAWGICALVASEDKCDNAESNFWEKLIIIKKRRRGEKKYNENYSVALVSNSRNLSGGGEYKVAQKNDERCCT